MVESSENKLRQISLMNEITRAALQADDLQSMTAELASRVGQLIGADSCFITLWDENRNLPIPAAAYGAFSEEYGSEPALPDEVTLTESVLRSGKPIVLDDLQDTEMVSPRIAALMPISSLLALPLVVGDQWLGAAIIAFEEPHSFTEEETEVSEQAANQIALAIAWAKLYEAEHQRSEELESLRRASIRLTSSIETKDVLDAILENALKLVQAHDAHIFLYDGELLTFAGARWTGSTKETPHSDPREDGLTYRVARTGEKLVIPDAASDPLYGDVGWRGAIIGLPLIKASRVLGVMNVAYQQPHHFGEAEIRVLELLADQAAITIENAGLYERTVAEHLRAERQLAELKTIQQVAQVVNRRLEMQPLLADVVHQVREVLGYPIVEIFLVEGDQLVQRSALEVLGKDTLSIPLNQGVVGRVARSNQPAFVPDVSKDPDFLPGAPDSLGEIAVPLHKGEVVIGVLNVESTDAEQLTEADVRLLTLLADQVSIAIENAALYDRLRQHTVDLETTVRERTDELAQALEVARQADRLKTQFVSDVSHELRTPLSNIRLYLELIEKGNQDRFREYLETLNRETDRLVALIEGLLTVSRFDAGTARPNPEPIDLNSLAQVLVQDRQRLCAERKLEMEFAAGDDLPQVMGDPHMVSQAIANLMTNAMNYTSAGGSIRIKTDFTQGDGREWVVLSVEDTGMGIPAEEQAKVFDRFFRGVASRQFGTPGTGLGLAIAKEIMESHGGDIQFESKLGQGTTFSVYLPVHPQI
jgi:signal transduction histidine kinase